MRRFTTGFSLCFTNLSCVSGDPWI